MEFENAACVKEITNIRYDAKYNSMPLVYAKYGILHNRMPRYGGAWMGYAKSYVCIYVTYAIVDL